MCLQLILVFTTAATQPSIPSFFCLTTLHWALPAGLKPSKEWTLSALCKVSLPPLPVATLESLNQVPTRHPGYACRDHCGNVPASLTNRRIAPAGIGAGWVQKTWGYGPFPSDRMATFAHTLYHRPSCSSHLLGCLPESPASFHVVAIWTQLMVCMILVLTIAIRPAMITIDKWCSHMTFCFTTALFSNRNSGLNCHHNTKTTCMILRSIHDRKKSFLRMGRLGFPLYAENGQCDV